MSGSVEWRDCLERSVLQEGIEIASVLLDSLQAILPPLQWVEVDGRYNWRYVEQLPPQAALLKLARQISSANALDVLMQRGFIQEVGSLMRGLDEINEDILFLCLGHAAGKWTDKHDAYLNYFWTDELGQPPVQRKTIRAFVNRVFEQQSDPSTADAVGRELYGAFSDYIHARATPIYGLVSGPPARFHLAGIRYNEALTPFAAQLPTYGFRCIISATAIAQAVSPSELGQVAYDSFRSYAEQHERLLVPISGLSFET